jgi:hypothetical protein
VRRAAFVTVAALAALVAHVVALSDLWNPTPAEWARWLVLEAIVAVVIGVVAASSRLVVAGVLGGWLLQALYFAVVTPKDENHNLWAVGLFELAFLGAVALGLALLARLGTGGIRRRLHG